MTGDDNGSLTVFLAVLATGLLALVGLVVDGGRAIVAKRQAIDIAEQAARVGADQLSVDALRSGQFVIDQAAARSSVERYLAAAGATGTASVSGGIVTVHVAADPTTVVLGIVGINDVPVSGTAQAGDVHGVTGPDR